MYFFQLKCTDFQQPFCLSIKKSKSDGTGMILDVDRNYIPKKNIRLILISLINETIKLNRYVYTLERYENLNRCKLHFYT